MDVLLVFEIVMCCAVRFAVDTATAIDVLGTRLIELESGLARVSTLLVCDNGYTCLTVALAIPRVYCLQLLHAFLDCGFLMAPATNRLDIGVIPRLGCTCLFLSS